MKDTLDEQIKYKEIQTNMFSNNKSDKTKFVNCNNDKQTNNDFNNINNIFKEEYVCDDKNDNIPKKIKCPIIKGKIGNFEVELLIDSGSEVTAIEKQFFWNNYDKFGHVEILPTTKTTIITAMGKRSRVSNKQVFVTIHIDNLDSSFVL